MQEDQKAKQIQMEEQGLSELELNNPFWQFSLKQWQDNAFQRLLIRLQDEQALRINLVLFSIWLSFEKKQIGLFYGDLIQSTQEWHHQIVTPLRNARKSLPSTLSNSDLKTHMQNSELQAEQYEQAILYRYSLGLSSYELDDIGTLDMLIKNLFASQLSETQLSLIIRACLPTYPEERISQRIIKIRRL